MVLTERDWCNIVERRCSGVAGVKCTLHTKRVHLDVTPKPGIRAHDIASAMAALVSDYASDVRVTWLVV